jgi:DNA (cytosine-5)-methyltransferase 1
MNTRTLKIGSLCTGYGGLDMAAMEVFGAHLAWCADNDRHVAKILAARYPGVPNLGDLTQLQWSKLEPVDILCAGFPCQDISSSGKRLGIEKGVRSGIWKNIVEGICSLRPKLIVVENVSAIRSRGLARVLRDLAQSGYDSCWTSLRASEVGAAHRRERIFILGYIPGAKDLLLAAYARSQRWTGWTVSREAKGWWASGGPQRLGDHALSGQVGRPAEIAWSVYRPAIRRWEAVTGRPAPYPTEMGTKGQPRLSPVFSEWLMGLPEGFVTDLGLPYSAKHRAIGNGVVPQQATVALRELIAMTVEHNNASWVQYETAIDQKEDVETSRDSSIGEPSKRRP